MNSKSIKITAINSLAWKTLETVLVNGVQTLIFLVLARLLMPADFGVVALVSAFIGISNVLVNSGLGTALIQSKQADETDYSTVLFFSFFISCGLYLLLFLTAPVIAQFYNEPVVERVLQIYSISIIFSAINGVQKSILLRELQFKKLFIVSSISVFFSGTVSIAIAMSGFGVFALVFNSVSYGLFSVTGLFIVMRWFPKLTFSIDRLRVLFSYSYKLLLSNLIETAYTNIFPLLIGKSFSSTQLGFYSNGRQIPNLVSSSINASIASVTFSIYSKYQSDSQKLKSMVRRSIIISNFTMLPIMGFLAAVAEPLVVLILTEKWLPSVAYLQLFCIVYGLHHQHNIGFQAIAAIGRSDEFLKYQIIKKVIGITLLLLTLKFGLVEILLGQIFTAIFSIIISIRPIKMLLNYTAAEQLSDFLPYLFITTITYLGVYLVTFLDCSAWVTLISQLSLGIALYTMLALSFKLKGLEYVLDIGKMYLGDRIIRKP